MDGQMFTDKDVKDAVQAAVARLAEAQGPADAVAEYLAFAAKRDAVALAAAKCLDGNDAEVQQLTADLNSRATLAEAVVLVLEKAQKYLPLVLAGL